MVVDIRLLDAVEPHQHLVRIRLETRRIHQLAVFVQIPGDIYVDTLELEEEVVLATALDFHVRRPVFLVGLESEERLLAIDHKLHISAFGVGEEVEPRFESLLRAGEDESPFAVDAGGVEHLVALAVIATKVHHGILVVLDFEREVIQRFLSCLCGQGGRQHNGQRKNILGNACHNDL